MCMYIYIHIVYPHVPQRNSYHDHPVAWRRTRSTNRTVRQGWAAWGWNSVNMLSLKFVSSGYSFCKALKVSAGSAKGVAWRLGSSNLQGYSFCASHKRLHKRLFASAVEPLVCLIIANQVVDDGSATVNKHPTHMGVSMAMGVPQARWLVCYWKNLWKWMI